MSSAFIPLSVERTSGIHGVRTLFGMIDRRDQPMKRLLLDVTRNDSVNGCFDRMKDGKKLPRNDLRNLFFPPFMLIMVLDTRGNVVKDECIISSVPMIRD